MNIALLGYGKMGKAIESIALDRAHSIVLKVDREVQNYDLSSIDVVIEFSTPDSAPINIKKSLTNNVPVICGTTGWLDKYPEIVNLCYQYKGSFLYASNFSIGVNIFFELNKRLSQLMKMPDYSILVEETHHTEKLDAPSGTAITLAEGIIENTSFKGWSLDRKKDNQIPIVSKREAGVCGTHTVSYRSDIDNIEIKHTAHNREGFALGAVIAAEWIIDKTGVFTMRDVLEI